MTTSPSPPRGLKKAVFVILPALVVLFIILAGAEIYLRQTSTYIIEDREGMNRELARLGSPRRFIVKYTFKGRRLIPNTRALIMNHALSHRDVEVRINAEGFRGPDIPAEKPAGQTRLLVLGDSITLADYLPEDETFVGVMAKRLRSLEPGRDILAVNGGVVDVGLKEELDILEESGLAIKPDVVVVAFYLNDSRPPYGFPDEKGSPGWLRRRSLLAEFIYMKFAMRRFVEDKGLDRHVGRHALGDESYRADRQDFMDLVHESDFDWGAAWKEDSWEAVGREMDRLKRLSEEHGFQVAVVCFPVVFQVKADFVEDAPQKRAGELAKTRGFAYLDLLPILRQRRDRDLFLDHCHPNQEGNRLIGEAIADFLSKN